MSKQIDLTHLVDPKVVAYQSANLRKNYREPQGFRLLVEERKQGDKLRWAFGSFALLIMPYDGYEAVECANAYARTQEEIAKIVEDRVKKGFFEGPFADFCAEYDEIMALPKAERLKRMYDAGWSKE